MSKLFCIILCFIHCSVLATKLAISPTRLYVSQNESITTLTLTNLGDTATLIQVMPKKWLPSNKLLDINTQDFIVSPLIFHLPPKKTQLIRLAYQGSFDPNFEKSYRLILQEVPEPNSPIVTTQLNVLLQLSLPVFIEPLASIEEKLTWHLVKGKAEYQLTAENRGNNIILIDEVNLITKRGNKKLPPSKDLIYLFPGARKEWQIKQDVPQLIEAYVNQKKQRFQVLSG